MYIETHTLMIISQGSGLGCLGKEGHSEGCVGHLWMVQQVHDGMLVLVVLFLVFFSFLINHDIIITDKGELEG